MSTASDRPRAEGPQATSAEAVNRPRQDASDRPRAEGPQATSTEAVNRPRKEISGGLRCREPAVATVQVDDAHVRVTRWDFAPGAETGFHRHGWYYVVVPVHDGTLHIEFPDGSKAEAALTAGVAYQRPAGIEHNVINGGAAPLSFVETELKALPG